VTTDASEPRGPVRLLRRLIHLMPVLVGLYFLAEIPLWLNWKELRSAADVASLVVVPLIFLAVVHPTRVPMCPSCVDQIPLDPQAAIDRHRRALFSAHVIHDRPYFSVAWLGALALLSMTTVHVTGVTTFYAFWDLAFLVYCYTAWRHHHLQPWCPFCQGWEDGGEPERVPDPDPSERATR